MQQELLLPFITYAIATSITPGPNTITSASAGMTLGYRGSLPYMFGIISGFFTIMIVAGLLTNVLTKANPHVIEVLKWIGVVYILWLASVPFLKYKSNTATSKNSSYTFLSGLSLQLVNIKLMVYSTTIYSSFALLIGTSTTTVLLSALFLSAIGFGTISLWAFVGVSLSKFFKDRVFYFVFNGILAVLLIAVAYSIVYN